MGILSWIIFGLLAGWVASLIVGRQGMGCLMDILLGLAGALVGGFVFDRVTGHAITGFNIPSFIIAVIGAVVVLLIFHAIGARSHRAP